MSNKIESFLIIQKEINQNERRIGEFCLFIWSNPRESNSKIMTLRKYTSNVDPRNQIVSLLSLYHNKTKKLARESKVMHYYYTF